MELEIVVLRGSWDQLGSHWGYFLQLFGMFCLSQFFKISFFIVFFGKAGSVRGKAGESCGRGGCERGGGR